MLGQVVQIVMSFRIICANSVELTAVISRAVRDINKKTISIVSFDKFAMLINFLFCVIWFPSVAQWTARGKDQNSDLRTAGRLNGLVIGYINGSLVAV